MKKLSTGSILLVTLWSLCLLAAFAAYLGYNVRQKIIMLQRLNSRDNLHYIAEAGVRQAIAQLRKEDSLDSEYDSLNSPWLNNPDIFKNVSMGSGEFTVSYEYIDYQSGSREEKYGIIDEQRKLNLNKATLGEMQSLIMFVLELGESEALELAGSILDWRDTDHAPSVPMGDAEDAYYGGLPSPYEAKDADFEVFDELLLVKNISQEILDKLKNYITIYGDGKININTAPAQVLLALGLEQTLVVDKLIPFRCGEDGIEGTEDDNNFNSSEPENINQLLELSSEEGDSLNKIAGKISVKSTAFAIQSKGQLGKQEFPLICVVDREGKILSWKEE